MTTPSTVCLSWRWSWRSCAFRPPTNRYLTFRLRPLDGRTKDNPRHMFLSHHHYRQHVLFDRITTPNSEIVCATGTKYPTDAEASNKSSKWYNPDDDMWQTLFCKFNGPGIMCLVVFLSTN